MLNKLLTHIQNTLSVGKILSCQAISGGSINQTYCLQTQNCRYMLKVNSKSSYPDMFECEATGLNAMRQTNAIAVPEIVKFGDTGDQSFLLLEWIETIKPTAQAFELLGTQLAQMHRHSSSAFGFETDNYMGSIKQPNQKHTTWTNFYIHERLIPMVKIAVDKRLLNNTDTQNFETLYNKLSNLFNEEPPALIHGDLWSGNYLIGLNNKPYLIDPAVSYGHREFDIAMTTLFGGFDQPFYIAYNNAFPLAADWQQRVNLWNLYPLLLHLNLFGAGYLRQVRAGLAGYI